MNNRLAFRPDLSQCSLEDRFLPALPGLGFPQFMPQAANNAILVPGFSIGGTGGGSSLPGPSFYYLTIGINLNGSGFASVGAGTGATIYGLGSAAASGGGSALGSSVGSGANTPGGGPSGGSFSSFAGYGGTFSSGYSFGLNASNNFGMSATTLGSVPVHTFDSGTAAETRPGQDAENQNAQTGGNNPSANPQGVGQENSNNGAGDVIGKNPLTRRRRPGSSMPGMTTPGLP